MEAQDIYTDNGIRTPYGTLLPPGARLAAYVRSGGAQSGDSAFIAVNLVATLAQGLASCRPGMGDFVVCLPGHAELVADATTISGALVNGAKVVGVGKGSNRPTFTFSATAASIAVSVANVLFTGCLFKLDGINAVVAPLVVTGADFSFLCNEVEVSAAAMAPTTALTLGTGADRADISGNVFRGLAASACGNGILVSGAINDARICDNEMVFAATSANGLVNVTGAALGLKILRNTLSNTVATSVAAIAYANVACSGQCANNMLTVLSTGAISPGVTGITVGGTNNTTGFFQNFTVNDVNKSGVLTPAVDT